MPNSSTFLGVFPGNIEFKDFSRKKSNSRTFKDLYEPCLTLIGKNIIHRHNKYFIFMEFYTLNTTMSKQKVALSFNVVVERFTFALNIKT